jgi:UDP-GlcNAc:undecaprenyl-phosphate GlcNAc-1-phosphate transferase
MVQSPAQMMLTFLCVVGVAFILSCILTPLARSLATNLGLVDHPDSRRKMHERAVPLAGGVAVLAAVCLVLGIGLAVSPALQSYFAEHPTHFLGLLLAALAICALGVLDDCRCLRGRHKLLGQVFAVGIVIAFDVQIRAIHLFGTDIDLGILSLPITFLWLLGAVNSLNLLDGMDGLLGSVGVIVTVTMAAMAILGGHLGTACVAAALAGALLGFLCYNFPPASVFLGDAGSMLIGLVIGVLGIESSLKAPATVTLIAPMVVLTIPFFDTLAAILRRKLTGRSIYTTDRGHLHHCLLQRGLSVRRVLLLVCLLTGLAGVGAFTSLALRNEALAVLASFAVVSILVISRRFGHAELELFAKRLGHLFGSFLEPPGKSRRLEVHLQGNADWKGLIRSVTDCAFDLNLQAVRLDVNAPALHEEYHGEWDRFDEALEHRLLWHVELPLAARSRKIGALQVTGYHDAEPLAEKVAVLARLIGEFEIALAGGREAQPAQDSSVIEAPQLENETVAAGPQVVGIAKLEV